MSRSRVPVLPGQSAQLQQYIEAERQLAARKPVGAFGRVSETIYRQDFNLRADEIALVNTEDGDVTAYFPQLGAGDLGRYIVVQRVSADVNQVIVTPTGSTLINGATVAQAVNVAYGTGVFLHVRPDEWVRMSI